MATYCIAAKRRKSAAHPLNSEFALWRLGKKKDGTPAWFPEGWKRAAEIAALLDKGDEVLTAEEEPVSITTGAPVEIELRIARNATEFKISGMPDA